MMVRCILLAAVHFAAGCLYGAGIVFRDPHDSGPLGLIYVVPLSFTMTLFYVWTLSAIIGTTHLLIERQQSYKLNMYNRLWRLLMLSLVLLFVYFVLNVMYTVFYSRPVLAASTWKWRWFWTDGWLNLEYFAVLATILFWWRPTTQNYRFGLEELAGNEEEAMERDQHDERDSFDNPRMGENLELDVIAHPNKGVPVSGDDVQFVVDDDEFNSDDDEDAPHLTEAAAAQKKGYAMAPGGGLVDRSSKADTLFEAPQFSDDDDEEDLASGSTSRAAKKGLKDD
ncbi:hypothetical protein FBU59_005418 [Linderina macrospora]|uniref:Uncharacterized protein n=1 Tax=Linderina macrospora TaxID=4868 RepID=A0ACC1J2R5_9FUNG|nr:hypothetical protein FBU59_005418 [Linderina macrospora]